MWVIQKTDCYERRHRHYSKKKKRELLSVLNNLDIFLASLRSGRKPKPFAFGFLHVEPSDVIAIAQTGGPNLAATRLYVYPDTETETLYVLTVGDKSTQPKDIQDCKEFVKQIRGEPNKGSVRNHGRDNQETEGQDKE
jgi:hypothetical protein